MRRFLAVNNKLLTYSKVASFSYTMYVVVMVGLPGSGKSTFAKQLSQASNFKLFELDQVFKNDPYSKGD